VPKAAPSPIAPRTVSRNALPDQVYEAVKERVVDQTYPPGHRLRVDEIALELGVSATPVREALNRLTAETLVILEPHRGFAVAPEPDLAGYAELFDACALLQIRAAGLAAARACDADLSALRQAVDGMDRACAMRGYEGFRAFTVHDRAFHDGVMALSGNRYLVALWHQLNPMALLARLYVRAFAQGSVPAANSSAEHRAVVAALEIGDAAKACELLGQHMERSKRRWLDFAAGGADP
jgi:DNA-binding GntR family transcriptional regulator